MYTWVFAYPVCSHQTKAMFLASVHATPLERKRSLPGDLLIPDPAAIVMHAVTIAAPPERVWPWLVQMGSGRAGWYSYDWVDNDGHPSATEIIPALQHVAPGDVLPSLPGVKESFIVAAVQPAARSHSERTCRRRRPCGELGVFPRTARSTSDAPARARTGQLAMAGGWSGKTSGLSAPYRTRLCVAREASALADGAQSHSSATALCRRGSSGGLSVVRKGPESSTVRRRSTRCFTENAGSIEGFHLERLYPYALEARG